MGEPYTVTALIVITLGGFGSMGGRWPAASLLGCHRGGGHALHQPVAQGLAVVRDLHRGAAVAAQRPVRPEMKHATQPADPSRAHGRRVRAALRRERLRRVDGAHVPDVRGAVVELGPLLRHHALPVARHLGLLRHRRLHRRARARVAAVGRRRGRRRGRGHGRRGGDGRGGAAPARHLLRRAHVRHDRADPPRHHVLGEAGHRHRGPRARGGARARHRLLHRAGARSRGAAAVDRRAAQPLRPRDGGHRVRRGACADARRRHPRRQDRRLRADGRGAPAPWARR